MSESLKESTEEGPWFYRPEEHDDWGIIRNEAGYVIGQISDPAIRSQDELAKFRGARKDPWERPARLAAAAPILLKALEQLLPTFDALERHGYRFDPDDVDFARKAVAEARGQATGQKDKT